MTFLPDPRLLDRLDLPRSQKVSGVGTGSRQSRRVGPGVEILSSRPYAFGDDSRQVDWNATARTGELHVKQRIADTYVPVEILVDASASMRFGTVRRKWDVAREAALLLAALAARGQDPTAVTVAGSTPLRVPIGPGRVGAGRAGEILADAPPWGSAGSLGAALSAVHTRYHQPRMLLVLTDMHIAESDLVSILGVSIRHSVALIEVVDPAELALPNAGRIRLQDPESGAQVTVNTGKDSIRAKYASAVEEKRQHITRSCRSRGVPVITLSTALSGAAQLAEALPRRGS